MKETKTCRKCKKSKKTTEFRKKLRNEDGFSSFCKECSVKYLGENYDKESKRAKKYYEKNKERIKERSRKYVQENKEKARLATKTWTEKNQKRAKQTAKKRRNNNKQREKEKDRQYYINNKEKCKEASRIYIENNYEKAREATKDWARKNKKKLNKKLRIKRKIDPQFAAIDKMRNRFYGWLRSQSVIKGNRTEMMMGYSLEELYKYLVNKGYDSRIHHIDHIIPLNSFDALNPDHIKIAWNYMNLQPLTPLENGRKHDKLIEGWDDLLKEIAKSLDIDPQPIIEYIKDKRSI